LRFVLVLTLAALASFPASALGRVIDAGLDVWITRGDGSTFFSFADDPLPRGFFCSGSDPFTGTIVFQGVPVPTEPEGVLKGADTILERLDHAVFDPAGTAITRLQIKALHFVGVEAVQTSCGAFQAEVVLDGEQPITEMRIHRENANGGRFDAEVAVRAKLVFTPIGRDGEVLEVGRDVTFPPRRNSFWAQRPGKGGVDHPSFVKVDTDNDLVPDTMLAGTSRNFAAGWPASFEQMEVMLQNSLARTRSRLSAALGDENGVLPEGMSEIDDGGLSAVTANLAADCNDNCHCEPSCGNHCLCPAGEICLIP
jgi:hypothetical protein